MCLHRGRSPSYNQLIPSIGKRHVVNFHQLTARAHVVAASTPDASERKWGAENLEGVEIYSDYDEMLERKDLDAIVVASITAAHAEQAIKAIDKGYHVLCEKPLSIDIDIVRIPPIPGSTFLDANLFRTSIGPVCRRCIREVTTNSSKSKGDVRILPPL